MFETLDGRRGELCFNVFDVGMWTTLPCDGKDSFPDFCLKQETWSQGP